jgi:hypothetical protein
MSALQDRKSRSTCMGQRRVTGCKTGTRRRSTCLGSEIKIHISDNHVSKSTLMEQSYHSVMLTDTSVLSAARLSSRQHFPLSIFSIGMLPGRHLSLSSLAYSLSHSLCFLATTQHLYFTYILLMELVHGKLTYL